MSWRVSAAVLSRVLALGMEVSCRHLANASRPSAGPKNFQMLSQHVALMKAQCEVKEEGLVSILQHAASMNAHIPAHGVCVFVCVCVCVCSGRN
jgi:hypothetical protein